MSQRSDVAVFRNHATVPVCCFDGGPVKDERDQQQSEAARERRAAKLKRSDRHASHCSDVITSGAGGIVLTAALKTQSSFAILCVLACFICLTSIDLQAQTQTRVRITVSPVNEIAVRAELAVPSRSWSFRNTYAGALGLADRIEQFRANDRLVRKLAVGEYRFDENAGSIDYVVRLRRPSPGEVAHVTWLTEDHGILMFSDLLPQAFESFAAEFVLPSGWTVQSSIIPESNGLYQVFAPDEAVFFVGRSIRRTSKKESEMFIAGTWPFKDSVAANAATRVMEKYEELTQFKLAARPVVMIAPLPVATGNTKWRAQTRGSTVLMLLDPHAQIANWKGQLEIVFTHEVLHLWVPNSLALRGDYDWFFEGFTLYTALLTALALKAIDFREYLDTLARVYDSYLSYWDSLSLIEASERRWTSNTPVVYDKGMLVAFLYDLLVRKESGGKRTVLDVYRELFSRPAADRADGNEVIIRLLSSTPAATDFAKAFILGNKQLEPERPLAAYGFFLDASGKSSRLNVAKEIDENQKRLLKSLGYRN